jgi:hypothetical protein
MTMVEQPVTLNFGQDTYPKNLRSVLVTSASGLGLLCLLRLLHLVKDDPP